MTKFEVAMAAPAIACDFATEHFIAIGNTGGVGPDVWQAGHSGSIVNLQNTTFSLFTGASQCYPSDCFATNPGRSGADEANNSLGYALFGDNVYDLIYSFAQTGSLTASFTASGLQAIGDEICIYRDAASLGCFLRGEWRDSSLPPAAG